VGRSRRRPRLGRQRGLSRLTRRIMALTLFVVAPAAVLAWYTWFRDVPGAEGGIASVEVLPWSIIARDQRNREIWTQPLFHEIAIDYYKPSLSDRHRYQICDLTGDGRKDLVFAVSYARDDPGVFDEILFFRWDGKPMASRLLTRPNLTDEINRPDHFFVSNVLAFHSAQGEPRILVEADHKYFYPSFAWLMDSHANLLREFTHDGHLVRAALWDADGDGQDEIVVGGCNNLYDRPILAVFEMDELGGSSPPKDYRHRVDTGTSPGHPLYYVLLSNLGEGIQLVPRASIGGLERDGEFLLISVKADGYGADYKCGTGFTDLHATMQEAIRGKYEQARLEDPTLWPVEQRVKYWNDNVDFWDGEKFVKEPTTVKTAGGD